MEQGAAYSVGERVWVKHTAFMGTYEAKVLKVEWRQEDPNLPGAPPQFFYFLHYNGWNKKYDDWQPESTIERTPPVIDTSASKAAKAKSQSQKSRKGQSTETAHVHHQLTQSTTDLVPAAGLTVLQLELDIPCVLKKALIDDHDAVSADGKLVPLPRTPCIIDILKKYEAHVMDGLPRDIPTAERMREAAEVEELVHGLRVYFDKMLSALLLYRSERAQALQALSDGRVPCAVFGAEHFLRLFVKLPEVLPTRGMTEPQLQQLANKLQDFLAWLEVNAASFLLPPDKYMEQPHIP